VRDQPPPEPVGELPRPFVQATQLVAAALSCALAILAFAWLDNTLRAALAATLLFVGAIGIVRRVPFAGSSTLGLVVAGLLVRFS